MVDPVSEAKLPGQDDARPERRKMWIFGVLMMAISLLLVYFFMVRPVLEAQRTGLLHYSVKGVLLPPALLYLGVASMVTDLRDGQIRQVNAAGKRTFTRKGWVFLGGLVVVLALSFAAWTLYLRSAGFAPV